MYTAKIQNKEFDNKTLKITVEFSNGTNTVVESCIPQDENGLKYWVKARLEQLNFAETDTKYNPGKSVDVSDPTPKARTPPEIAQDEWFKNYTRWVRIKTTMIDTGLLTGSEPKVVALKNKVISDFLPAYIDII